MTENIKAILDTNILIDLLRNTPAAHKWFSEPHNYAVTHIMWAEIVEGSKHKAALNIGVKLLQRFELISIEPDDWQTAIESYRSYWLSHRIDMNDCLISAVVKRVQIPLYTRNLRHFKLLINDLAVAPY
jgi:hypothetical protein